MNKSKENHAVKEAEKKAIDKLGFKEMLKVAREKQLKAQEKAARNEDQEVEYVRKETETEKIFIAKTKNQVELEEAEELVKYATQELVKEE